MYFNHNPVFGCWESSRQWGEKNKILDLLLYGALLKNNEFNLDLLLAFVHRRVIDNRVIWFYGTIMRWKWEDNVGFGGRNTSHQPNHLHHTLSCLVGSSLAHRLLSTLLWRSLVMRSHFTIANLVLRYKCYLLSFWLIEVSEEPIVVYPQST